MQASEEKFTKFISDEVTLVIPVYQRNYDWRKSDCQQLLNDIENIIANAKPHFIGTFVYTYDPAVGTQQEYIIIDGQQRITSIILFAKALYDLTDDADLKEDIRSKFIKHTTGRVKVLTKIISPIPKNLPPCTEIICSSEKKSPVQLFLKKNSATQ